MSTKKKIINVTLIGTECQVDDIAGYYVEISNCSGSTVYASVFSGIIPGNEYVMPIHSGCKGVIALPFNSNVLYLLGKGQVTLKGTDYLPESNDIGLPNLLINPDFRNPINQRELSEYTAAGYTIDRWRISTNGNLTINQNSITITALNDNPTYFLQIFENYYMLDGMDVTLSVCDENDNVISRSGKVPSGDVEQTTSILSVPIGACQFILWKRNDGKLLAQVHIPAGETVTLKWAKLEAGAKYTKFSPPDFGTELIKCQRFFQLHSTNDIKEIDMRPRMRAKPDITSVGDKFAYNAEIN